MRSIVLFLILCPMLAFGADSVAVDVPNLLPPETVIKILDFLQTIPKVGPYIVMVLKGIAIIAPIMTALSVCVQAVAAIPEVTARFAGFHNFADKWKLYTDKVVYWLSFLSIRNAKK